MGRISRQYRHPLGEQVLQSVTQNLPWKHFIFDDFLSRATFLRAQKEVTLGRHRFEVKEGDPYKLRFCLLRQMDLLEAFLSLQFHNLMTQVTGARLTFNSANSLQLRLMDEKSPPFPRHLDFYDDGRRSFIAIFYLGVGATMGSGGELGLHESINSPEDKAVLIEPTPNRLVIFSTDHTNWHAVRRVSGGKRYSILGEWIVK